MQDKFLPVGTVVLLKNGSKRIMITGFCTTADDDPSKVYDYSGCLFPEGFIEVDKNLLFDHDQIERIDHMGLVDDEEKAFKIRLNELIKTYEDK